jgi:hypothetical protein
MQKKGNTSLPEATADVDKLYTTQPVISFTKTGLFRDQGRCHP